MSTRLAWLTPGFLSTAGGAWGHPALPLQRTRGHNHWGLGDIMLRLQSTLGVFALLLIAFALAENRRAVSVRQALIGLV